VDPNVKNIYFNFLCLPANPTNRKVKEMYDYMNDISIQVLLGQHREACGCDQKQDRCIVSMKWRLEELEAKRALDG